MTLISYHGGHSGEFCDHASDMLESIVQSYVSKGFTNFGITEHQPRPFKYFYPDEHQKSRQGDDLFIRFNWYMRAARALQQKLFTEGISMHVGFETEMCGADALGQIELLKRKHEPDYLVGSVHHVKDIPIDYDKAMYAMALQACGGLEQLHLAYYDLQFDLIKYIKPEIIGHFDLIKIFSPDYVPSKRVLAHAEINIRKAIEQGAVFEVNSRAFKKSLIEPHPGRVYLRMIRDLGGEVTLGDDSHAVDQVGLHYDKAILVVKEFFDTVVAFKLEDRRGGMERIHVPIQDIEQAARRLVA